MPSCMQFLSCSSLSSSTAVWTRTGAVCFTLRWSDIAGRLIAHASEGPNVTSLLRFVYWLVCSRAQGHDFFVLIVGFPLSFSPSSDHLEFSGRVGSLASLCHGTASTLRRPKVYMLLSRAESGPQLLAMNDHRHFQTLVAVASPKALHQLLPWRLALAPMK